MDTSPPLPLAVLRESAPEEAIVRPARHSWPLMGDIVACRGGVPELLIQWRRAAGEDDPPPSI